MLISRYLFRQTASALIMILVSLTLIMWLTSLLREIKLLTTQGQTFLLFLKITSLAIPNLLMTVAPVAFLIACLYTLNKANGDSELIVLSAAGTSVWRVATPYLVLGTLVSLFVLVANHFILPPAARLLNDYVGEIRSDILSQILQPGEFSELEKGMTFHIRGKTQDNTLLGVVIHDERDPKNITTVIADQGVIVSDGARSVMDLQNGQILRRPEAKVEARIVNFQRYTFDLTTFSPRKGAEPARPRERSTWDLFNPDPNEFYYRENKSKFRSEIHERFSTALYGLLFAFIALVYLGRPRTTRQGRGDLLFGAFAIGALIRMVGIAGINLSGKHVWALSLVYGIPAGVMILSLIMLKYNIEPVVLAFPSLPKFALRKRQPALSAA